MLLDSNILIYAAEPEGAFLSRWVEDAAACLATVSRIEVLGFPRWHLLEEMRRARMELLVGAHVWNCRSMTASPPAPSNCDGRK
jgi:hypothetical protein